MTRATARVAPRLLLANLEAILLFQSSGPVRLKRETAQAATDELARLLDENERLQSALSTAETKLAGFGNLPNNVEGWPLPDTRGVWGKASK